ncbi:MAG: nodulation protein NodH [Rhodobacteraceae bacterium]|jgi:LPS sulfotransferase NodH|nr:nodulation protein NodH [Paracoccaceae bacterium]
MVWDCFVILAGMRTGSNLLQETLDAHPGLACHGELFNPVFIGRARVDRMWRIDLAARNADPLALIARMRARSDGLAGFRLFPGHDPRVLAHVLDDPRVAKIILTRNPLEQYLSQRIAEVTGQWRLGDATGARTARVRFDADGFAAHLADRQAHLCRIERALQVTGQTAFRLDYADLTEPDVLTGLARFLGVEGGLAPSGRTKKQNPAPPDDLVDNPDDMRAALAGAEFLTGASAAAVWEPRRGPGMPRHVAAVRAPLLHLALDAGGDPAVEGWLAGLDGVGTGDLRRGFTQRSLRAWRGANPGARSFAVVRHPGHRLHAAFRALAADPTQPRAQAMARGYGVALSDAGDRDAYLAFLGFVTANLDGQTSLPVHPSWATQAALLDGVAQAVLPDVVLRADRLEQGLAWLAREVGRDPPDMPLPAVPPLPFAGDRQVAAAVAQAHRRDMLAFGFAAQA